MKYIYSDKELLELNKAFFRTLDYFIQANETSRTQVCRVLGYCSSSLNKSKKKNNNWIGFGFFLEIVALLGITPIEFFEMMNVIKNN